MFDSTRILIVDDDPLAREVYSDCLRDAGYQVLAAADARAAAEQLSHQPVDVVVTDLILPEQDGLAVLADAKKRDPGIEVIVITAVDSVEQAVRAIKGGAADYLVKPVPPESLQRAVTRCLATRQLLQENELLRQSLSLVETGQRLATTLQRDQLLPMATEALAQALLAPSALLFARRPDGGFELAGAADLSADEVERLSRAALPRLSRLPPETRTLELEGETVGAVQAATEEGLQAVCLVRGAAGDAMAWSNAHFLARHLALALQNLNRLTAAEDLAFLDDLTKLHNQRFLHTALDREITISMQTGAPFSVLFIDLDRFKQVNDTHGHLVGSKLLVEMGELIKSCVRDQDVTARYGGDEYVVVLVHTDSEGAMRIGERIRHTIEQHRFLAREGLGLTVTACVGIAAYPEHARDKQHILDAADQAMYQGKQSTRNAVYLASLPKAKTA